MSENDYGAILDRVRSEMVEPVTIPTGTWLLEALVGKYTTDTGDDEIMASGGICFKPIEAGEDVDEELLAEYIEESLESDRFWFNFWLRDVREQNKMFDIFGAMDMPNYTIKESCENVKGFRVMAYVYQKPRKKDPEIIDTSFKDFTPVED